MFVVCGSSMVGLLVVLLESMLLPFLARLCLCRFLCVKLATQNDKDCITRPLWVAQRTLQRPGAHMFRYSSLIMDWERFVRPAGQPNIQAVDAA